MNLGRRKAVRLVLIAALLLAVALSMTASTAAVDFRAGPFEIWPIQDLGTL
jgi:uncharacterized protein YraI